MSAVCFSIDIESAKKAGRERSYSTPQSVRLVDRILKVSQSIIEWQRSPQKELAKAADVSPRSVEYWGDGRGLSSEALANLIRSEEGYRFLEAIMDGAQPKWWRLCVPLMQFAEVREMQIQARRKMRRAVQGALDADADLSAGIAAAEAAPFFHDEEFMRPQLDARRAMGRAQNRAVAQADKGRP